MSIHTTDAVSEGSAVIDQAEDESSLHAEVRQLLEKADAYKQSPTEVPYVPNLQISNNEHFATADLNLSATTDAIPVPHAETAKTDAGFFGVVGDIIGGGIHHVLTNPMDVVHSLATGVVLSVAIGAGIAGATALAATAPAWVPIAGAVALAAGAGWLTGWMAAEHVPKWWNDADTVWNSSKHTDEEVAAARQGLQDLGGGTVDFLAGMVGGGWIYNQLAKTAMKTGTDAAANEIRVANAEVNTASESAEQVASAGSKAAVEAKSAGEAAESAVVTQLSDEAIAGNVTFPTGLTGEELIKTLKLTAKQEQTNLMDTAIHNLSKPEDIAEFAKQFTGLNGMEYINAANSIRRYPFFSFDQTARFQESWLKAAEAFEAKALPLLRESATSHSWLKTPSPAELRSSQRLLAGLESGLKADRLIGDMNAARLAIEEPRQAITWIGRPGEIETFLDEYKIMHPSFRKEVEAAIKSGAIPPSRAAKWETALQTMPKSQDTATVSIAIDGKGPRIFQAVEEAAHRSILPTDQYALLHLKDRTAIESFTAEWKKKFPNVNDFALRIAQALKYKMVQPGSESAWDDAVSQLYKQ